MYGVFLRKATCSLRTFRPVVCSFDAVIPENHQSGGNRQNARVLMTAMNGQVVARKDFVQGSSVCYIETATLYEGHYVLTFENNGVRESYPVMIRR